VLLRIISEQERTISLTGFHPTTHSKAISNDDDDDDYDDDDDDDDDIDDGDDHD